MPEWIVAKTRLTLQRRAKVFIYFSRLPGNVLAPSLEFARCCGTFGGSFQVPRNGIEFDSYVHLDTLGITMRLGPTNTKYELRCSDDLSASWLDHFHNIRFEGMSKVAHNGVPSQSFMMAEVVFWKTPSSLA